MKTGCLVFCVSLLLTACSSPEMHMINGEVYMVADSACVKGQQSEYQRKHKIISCYTNGGKYTGDRVAMEEGDRLYFWEDERKNREKTREILEPVVIVSLALLEAAAQISFATPPPVSSMQTPRIMFDPNNNMFGSIPTQIGVAPQKRHLIIRKIGPNTFVHCVDGFGGSDVYVARRVNNLIHVRDVSGNGDATGLYAPQMTSPNTLFLHKIK